MNKKKYIVALVLIIIAVLFILNLKTIGRKLYPLRYKDLILDYSKEYDLDPSLVAGLIDVESGFDKNAVSPKGAIGLMQILPKTGKWIAGRNGIDDYENWMLYTPEMNIRLGTWYLDNLRTQFKDVDLVLAAYNGGSGNVTKWLKDRRYSEDGKKLKDIPFKETKDYVKKVKFRRKIYSYLYDI